MLVRDSLYKVYVHHLFKVYAIMFVMSIQVDNLKWIRDAIKREVKKKFGHSPKKKATKKGPQKKEE